MPPFCSNTLTQVIISAVKHFFFKLKYSNRQRVTFISSFSSQKTEQANFFFSPQQQLLVHSEVNIKRLWSVLLDQWLWGCLNANDFSANGTTLTLMLTFSLPIIPQTFHTRHYSLSGQDDFRRFFLIKSGCKHKIKQSNCPERPTANICLIFSKLTFQVQQRRNSGPRGESPIPHKYISSELDSGPLLKIELYSGHTSFSLLKP